MATGRQVAETLIEYNNLKENDGDEKEPIDI